MFKTLYDNCKPDNLIVLFFQVYLFWTNGEITELCRAGPGRPGLSRISMLWSKTNIFCFVNHIEKKNQQFPRSRVVWKSPLTVERRSWLQTHFARNILFRSCQSNHFRHGFDSMWNTACSYQTIKSLWMNKSEFKIFANRKN